jgi:hypothetical protein
LTPNALREDWRRGYGVVEVVLQGQGWKGFIGCPVITIAESWSLSLSTFPTSTELRPIARVRIS